MEVLRVIGKIVLSIAAAGSFTWSALMFWMLYKAKTNDVPREKLTSKDILLFTLLMAGPPAIGAGLIVIAYHL